MEECNGGEFFDSLAKRAKEKQMYTEKECAKIFKQILEAVNYLHAHGVCHRDLKPENIGVDEDMHLKIFDFATANIHGKYFDKSIMKFVDISQKEYEEAVKNAKMKSDGISNNNNIGSQNNINYIR